MSSLGATPTTAEAPPPFASSSRGGMPAWMMSIFLHVCLMTTAGLMFAVSEKGTEQEIDRPIGIALVQAMPDRDKYQIQPDQQHQIAVEGEANDASVAALSAAAPPAGLNAPLDLQGILADLSATPMPGSNGSIGDALQASEATRPGTNPLGDGGSQPTTTKVFGVSGTGSRFVYVFDRSDSMNGYGGRPLQAAKTELLKSLRTLGEQQQFQIIFYNNRPSPFRPIGSMNSMLVGSDEIKASAEKYVKGMRAFGGTQHEDAIKLALRLKPDVIFFLTDARVPRLTGLQLRSIRARASKAGTTIHAIEFGADGSSPSDSFLQELAAQNGGQYRYLDVRSFRQDGQWDGEPES